ncbi:MAG: FAD:protein FMN transferase [Pirellulales bacterium]
MAAVLLLPTGLPSRPATGQDTLKSQTTETPKSGQQKKAEPEVFELVFPAMGSSMMFRAFDDDETQVNRAFGAARSLIGRLEDIYTDYDPESETSLLSEKGVGPHGVTVSDDLASMITLSERWHSRSDGVFDASLGKLTHLWRSAKKKKQVPEDEAVQDALRHSGWQHVTWDSKSKTLKLDTEGVQFDFGAIAKGYAVDRAFEILQQHGLKSCLVNASGNMRCGDPPPGLAGWRIDVAGLTRAGAPICFIELNNQSIATSGDLWQFQLIRGERRSHILDPRTGWGLTGSISATIVAPTAADADACATAVCVQGPDGGADLIRRLNTTSGTKAYRALILRRESADGPVTFRNLGLQ